MIDGRFIICSFLVASFGSATSTGRSIVLLSRVRVTNPNHFIRYQPEFEDNDKAASER